MIFLRPVSQCSYIRKKKKKKKKKKNKLDFLRPVTSGRRRRNLIFTPRQPVRLYQEEEQEEEQEQEQQQQRTRRPTEAQPLTNTDRKKKKKKKKKGLAYTQPRHQSADKLE